ncbi:hypothetical protein [Rhizobium sp. BK060]|uniref:hypothetical protein n=1 Tax=Rhizobium sp. BK060 TaxID=2587096 RepID=UPI00160E603A|nr:hypothetical protein [Rhizobium sp. BK060]MBB3396840.1 hypothetical protein [Rhizobium sp. BK060]
MADRAYLERLARELTDKGQLIEAGWVSLRIAAVPLDASPTQLEEMRNAFFAGAQHLFASIMTILEPDAEPTEKDLDRMSLIDAELRAFIQVFELKHFPAKGRA